jgi:hypothetical protein
MEFIVKKASIFKSVKSGTYSTNAITLSGTDLSGFEVVDEQVGNVASMQGIVNYGELVVHIYPYRSGYHGIESGFSIEVQQLRERTESVGKIFLEEEEFQKFQQDLMGFGQKCSTIHLAAKVISEKIISHRPIKIVQQLDFTGIEFVL